MRISEDLYWLEITVYNDWNEFVAGQWVYLTAPSISLFERHPFTVALVIKQDRGADFELDDDSGMTEELSQDLLISGAKKRGTRLRFLVREQNNRQERSWTHRLRLHMEKHKKCTILGIRLISSLFSLSHSHCSSRSGWTLQLTGHQRHLTLCSSSRTHRCGLGHHGPSGHRIWHHHLVHSGVCHTRCCSLVSGDAGHPKRESYGA